MIKENVLDYSKTSEQNNIHEDDKLEHCHQKGSDNTHENNDV